MPNKSQAQQAQRTMEIVDVDKVGKKGVPRHYQAFGIEPPMKTVPVDENGNPDIMHPGLEV